MTSDFDVFSLRRPGADVIERLLADQRERSVTYGEVGATRAADGPSGYRRDLSSVDLGSGDTVFARGCEALRCWAVHRGAGIEVLPVDASIAQGETVVLVVPMFGFHVMAACRVVWTVDEIGSFGFGYGTLPSHPERGEEAFVVRRGPHNRVIFEIRAFSHPAHPLARAGAPVTRRLQQRATRRYLGAIQAWVSPPS